MTRRELSASPAPFVSMKNSRRWLRILRVFCAKLRVDGPSDSNALAKATPGYVLVGADLSALAGAAGIIAVKRIFNSFSDGTIVIPDNSASTTDADATTMQVDVSHSVPVAAISNPPAPTPDARPGELATSFLSNTNLPIAHFLPSHPAPLTPAQLVPLCITAANFMLALKKIQPSAQREGFATVPDVTWSDIGALHATRSELHMAVVQPIRRPELFRAVGIDALSGVLLWVLLAAERHCWPRLLRTRVKRALADVRCSMLARVSAQSVRYLRERAPHLLASSFSTNSTHSFQDAMKRSPNLPRASSTPSLRN